MRLSEFLKLKYSDRVTLLFIWCNIDDKDKQYALEYYDYDYRRIFREYFIFLGKKDYDIIEEIVRRGFVIDDTVDVTTKRVSDNSKAREHAHVIFDDVNNTRYGKTNHISCSLTTKNTTEFPSKKLDFDAFLGDKESRITDDFFIKKKSKYHSESPGKMSIKDYYDKLNRLKKDQK